MDFENGPDSLYDSSFSTEINSKMHVPDKISADGLHDQLPMITSYSDHRIPADMNVPERILLTGLHV